MLSIDQIKPLGPVWPKVPVDKSDVRQKVPENPVHDEGRRRKGDKDDGEKPEIDEFV